ncbi:MAG: DNA mismatch repair protein MutS [Deltaproteobacteria bacterium]|nr:DNA mismatch repair protein MutS [Deltaproteobacteria bacterium]
MSQMTPMLKQYTGIKSDYPDAILFYRMGDFYEMFFEDARTASKVLGITLTSRGTLNGEKVPMCGVPHHSAKGYISRLISEGLKVAVCEQTEDPKASKGIVKRDVVRLVTPGSVVDEVDVDETRNLYMAAASGREGRWGLAHADLSTGEFRVTEVLSLKELSDELERISPAELLLPEGGEPGRQNVPADYRIEVLDGDAFERHRAERFLKDQLGVRSLAGFGCEDMPEGIRAAGALAFYLKETQKETPQHIKELQTYRVGDFMYLDAATCAHLELLQTMRRQSVKGSLYHVLNRTITPMGGRLLKRWMIYPLIESGAVRNRLAAVSCFKDDTLLREDIRQELEDIYDLERLNGRIALGRANARDLLSLERSIRRLPGIKERTGATASMRLSEIAGLMDTLDNVAEWIAEAIHDDPPVAVKDGGIIREGYHEELDRLIGLSRDGKSWIARFAAHEQKRTGISSLKVGFNKVFGYYIEVTKANLHLVPEDYVRKQTLANGERYITDELKAREEQVLGAEERRVALELEIFERIRARVAGETRRIKATAELVAEIDVLAGLAEVAQQNNYCLPEIGEGLEIELVEARHPVVELAVRDEAFVPNDIRLDGSEQQLLIITGPNMAGKSTVLRQTALAVLMAQMGSFVPAARAVIGMADRIFSRVGASDDLARGRSTFMVEMSETANILHNATPRSLVILDEIGRGTSTFDGLSIAWSVAEALHDREDLGVRTLFATHYHELTELVAAKQRAKNYNIAVREWNDQVVFLRKLVPGGTSRSYGIQVARIAGIPEPVLKRAKEILETLEQHELSPSGFPRLARASGAHGTAESAQLNLFGGDERRLSEWVEGLDITGMTPLEALVELSRLKEFVIKDK